MTQPAITSVSDAEALAREPFNPTAFVDDLLSACDASNWDAERNKDDYYQGLKEAYDTIHEIVSEYQTAMYKCTKALRTPIPVAVSREDVARAQKVLIYLQTAWIQHNGVAKINSDDLKALEDVLFSIQLHDRVQECSADMYALWCDKCHDHPAKCPLKLHDRAAGGGKMKDFMCESEEFNGSKCKVQCSSCKPKAIPAKAEAEVGVREALDRAYLQITSYERSMIPATEALAILEHIRVAAFANLPTKTEPKP